MFFTSNFEGSVTLLDMALRGELGLLSDILESIESEPLSIPTKQYFQQKLR